MTKALATPCFAAEHNLNRAEIARLREEVFLLESQMDMLPDSIYFKDRESRFTRVNRATAMLFGVEEPNEVIGRTDFDYFTDEPAAKAYRAEQEIVRTGLPLVNVEEKATKPDGSIRWVSPPKKALRDADTAMYRAKANGRSRHQVFDVDMHQRAVSLLRLETDLRRAIERQELVAYYQPIVDLETKALRGFEALARWKHPTRGLIMPDVFIPVAEETGQIAAIGDWMLAEACRQMRVWQDRHPRNPPLHISVNVSTRQLAHANVPEQVERILNETGLHPSSLTLEITESALMQNLTTSAAVIQKLNAMAIRLHIDDFGTGYSSLSYLQNFPIHTLKVDKSFVTRMGDAPKQGEIVRAIVSLAQNLGMEVTAEGVETADQAQPLQSLNCTRAQGYLFSRPVPADEAERIIVDGLAPRAV